MYVPTDADVLEMLEAFKVDPEHSGAKTASDRFRLLRAAIRAVQGLGRVMGKDDNLDPRTLKSLNSRSTLVAEEFDMGKMYSMQEQMGMTMGVAEDNGWFEWRHSLCNLVEKHIEEGTKRVHVVDNESPHRMGGFFDILGARLTGDGKVPLLETRHRFFYMDQVDKGYAEAEMRTNLPGPADNVIIEVEHNEIKLMAAMFDANAACLCRGYIEAQQASWGTGSHFTPSFLLPLEPLSQEIKLAKACQVCGKEGARDCSACHTVAYCGTDCQTKDWKQHKPMCKKSRSSKKDGADASSSTAQASSSSGSSGSGGSVVVNLQADPIAPFVANIPTNVSSRKMQKALKKPPTPSSRRGVAPGVKVDPSKRFLVKIQAPLGGDGLPLYLYDEKRKVVAYIQNNDQQPTGTFSALLRAIHQHGVMGGVKAYFWAALESEEKLVVYTDQLPGQTHSW